MQRETHIRTVLRRFFDGEEGGGDEVFLDRPRLGALLAEVEDALEAELAPQALSLEGTFTIDELAARLAQAVAVD